MKKKVTSYAPINIALCKYWGKKDEELVLPFTSSISVTLKDFYTKTSIEEAKDGVFEFYLNGRKEKTEAHDKVLRFCKLFTNKEPNIIIRSTNNVPTSAGLASSASGFAALALALDAYYETNYEMDELVKRTRVGSGSAARSLLDGFVHWKTDGLIEKITDAPKDLVVIAVIISSSKKHISSRKAMKIGVETSPFYYDFINKNQEISYQMIEAMIPFDFDRVGKLMEESTALMHQVMHTSNPKIQYQKEESLHLIQLVEKLRNDGIKAYTTMDAGPNVKIFTKKEYVKDIEKVLSNNGYNTYFILKPGSKAEVIENE